MQKESEFLKFDQKNKFMKQIYSQILNVDKRDDYKKKKIIDYSFVEKIQ